MALAMWFYLFLALSLLSGIWGHWQSSSPAAPYLVWGHSLLLFLLLLILGLKVFGSPITG